MRVFQINTVTGGSTGKIARDIAAGIKASGGESIIAYGRGGAPDDGGEYYKFASTVSMYTHALLSRITDKSGFYSKKDTLRLIEKIKEYSPDVIHLHNIHGYYLNIEVLFNFLKEYRRPVVWTLHDCWTFTGHCAYFDYANCKKWHNGCFDCPGTREYPKSLFLDNSFDNYIKKKKLFSGNDFLTLVPVSGWLADNLEKSFLKDTRRRVINNGINTDLFKYTPSDIREKYGNKKIILGVANIWDRRKGLTDFIKLSEKLPYDEYQIVLVGLSKQQIKSLPKEIVGLRRTNSVEELIKLYSAAEVFVNLTYEDNLPTVNIEASACTTPVISYDTGGCSECIFGGKLVECGNVSGVYEAIINKDYQKPYLDLELLDRRRMSEEYINLYNSLKVLV